jgi:hypothetical protein
MIIDRQPKSCGPAGWLMLVPRPDCPVSFDLPGRVSRCTLGTKWERLPL